MTTTSKVVSRIREPRPNAGLRRAADPPEGGDRSGESDLALLRRQVMHDVRNDLFSLSIVAKLLLRGRYGSLPSGVSEQIDVLEKKAHSAAGLLDGYCRLKTSYDGSLSYEEEIDFRRDVILAVKQELALELTTKKLVLSCRVKTDGRYFGYRQQADVAKRLSHPIAQCHQTRHPVQHHRLQH